MDMLPEFDVYRNDVREVRAQIEVHLVGAHVCLTHRAKGSKLQRVWVTWLPRETPHVGVCGVLFGKCFRLNVALWPRPPC